MNILRNADEEEKMTHIKARQAKSYSKTIQLCFLLAGLYTPCLLKWVPEDA